MGKKHAKEPDRGRAKGSILWKHLLMMLCVLLLALIAMTVSNGMSMKTLTEENLAKYQTALERNCAEFNDDLYATTMIPVGIEQTRHYMYISGIHSGKLETRYYPLLDYIQRALGDQLYLRGESSFTALYIAGCNSMITTIRMFPEAEDCMKDFLKFSEIGGETVLGYLRESNCVMLLPMQQTEIGTRNQTRYLPLIVRPANSNMSVMSLYSEDTVLEALGYTDLPEGTYLKMTAKDGRILCQYPQEITEETSGKCYQLTGKMENLNVTVQLWIPKAYFGQLLRLSQLTGMLSIVLVTVLGTAMSIFFSKASVLPIRRLIRNHGEESGTAESNEITQLDRMLSSSRQRSKELQKRLTEQIFTRALSGAVLSEYDERYLEQEFLGMSENFRIAILHAPSGINEMIGDHLVKTMGDIRCALINRAETGVLFAGTEAQLEQLGQIVQSLNEQSVEGEICCGVSTPAWSLRNLHVAVRQARVSLPQNGSIKIFPGERTEIQTISWLQQERLYQSICEKDRESATRLLDNMARQTGQSGARYVFYNICFVIRSASEEMGVSSSLEEKQLEYIPSMLPRENIQRLAGVLDELFEQIEKKVGENVTSEQERLLDFVRQNYSDYLLCAPFAAAKLGMPEKRVYETIRNATGMSFNEYLLSLRMKCAAVLLCTTGESVGDVAKSCGYQSESTFYRLFKKYYGVSPGQYRKEGGMIGDQGNQA